MSSLEKAEAVTEKQLHAFLRRIEAATLATERPRIAPLVEASAVESSKAEATIEECDAAVRILKPACAGDVAAVLSDPWLAPLAATLARERVDAALAAGGHQQLLEELRGACREFLAAAQPGGICAEARGLGLLLLAVSALQLYLRATWTGPVVESCEEQQLPFDPNGKGCAKLLAALEVDGEPAYELLVGPGYLWLASALLGVLPEAGDAKAEGTTVASMAAGATLAVWRGRCAFVWQLSLAEASERGMGQSPWLFRLSVHDLVGTADYPGPLAGAGVLHGEALQAAQATTAPVLKACLGRGDDNAAASKAAAVVAGTSGTANAEEVPAGSPLVAMSEAVRSTVVVEFAIRLCWYGRGKVFDQVLAAACDSLRVAFKVTGVLGIKRKYQHTEFAQLAVKMWPLSPELVGTTSPANRAGAVSSTIARAEDVAPEQAPEQAPEKALEQAPGNLKLLEVDDMNDVLEAPKLSAALAEEERLQFERPLTGPEQVVLLARCHYLWAMHNPNDEMTLQEVNALAQRVIATEGANDQTETRPEDAEADAEARADGPLLTANWLNFSCGLFYRCRAEHHRNKTRERAAFQLQSLVDQYSDEKPSAAHRLLFVHSSGYPARFHLQREMGMRMMRMGMVSTAHEQFKKLRMWPEAVDCLMVAERNVEAIDLVKELLAESPTPRLWCCLGDLEKEPKHYETAWELSNQRFARAQRSLGREHFQKGRIEKAVDSFRASLEINPLHAGVWFTMGVAEMRLERWDSALVTFARCIGVEDDNSEAWANLAAVHSAKGNKREARNCMFEATKRARENWRMWENFLGVCMSLRDIQGCIQSLRRLVELDQTQRIEQRVLGAITVAVVTDQGGLYEGRSGGAFVRQLDSFFELLTSKNTSIPFFWYFYAELQESRGQREEALQSRFKQSRAAQAKLWDENDPQRFAVELDDLCECFKALEEALADPAIASVAHGHKQPFLYSVRNAVGRMQTKIASVVGQVPSDWHEALQTLKKIAASAAIGVTDVTIAEGEEEEQ
mmetsp:Transcript_66769/g.186223  ORF Transcript_66769/g.186223 Transcript_66769/m.186223 type:complete len:1019 (-) Transcript_66769:102-3158(-)